MTNTGISQVSQHFAHHYTPKHCKVTIWYMGIGPTTSPLHLCFTSWAISSGTFSSPRMCLTTYLGRFERSWARIPLSAVHSHATVPLTCPLHGVCCTGAPHVRLVFTTFLWDQFPYILQCSFIRCITKLEKVKFNNKCLSIVCSDERNLIYMLIDDENIIRLWDIRNSSCLFLDVALRAITRAMRFHLYTFTVYPTPGCENQWIWFVVSKAVDTTGPNLHIGYNTLICITVARERTCSWHSCHIWRL